MKTKDRENTFSTRNLSAFVAVVCVPGRIKAMNILLLILGISTLLISATIALYAFVRLARYIVAGDTASDQ
jgi:hypothetical protein